MGYLILWAPTSEGSDHALENVAHILLKNALKKVCALFMKMFSSQDNYLFLRLSTNQN